jgi:hypothetical protein
MAIVAPERLYVLWGLAGVAAIAGLIASRDRFRDQLWQQLLVTCGLACLAYIGYNAAFEQFQGRYLFTALVPIAVLKIGGWSALFPERARAPGVAAIAAGLVALNAYALVRVLVPGFAPGT